MLGPLWGLLSIHKVTGKFRRRKKTASTFIENALEKARNAARHTGLPSLADDSGLGSACIER